jgi:ribosomal protein RSM22 (predicted rRNA methylase)
MSSELPPGLRAAIDRELSGASRRDLAQRTAATTEAYRAGRGSSAVIKGRDDALAYALARLPATYAADAAVFDEARARVPGFAPRTLLDAGCGPGGGSWAALEAWPSLEQITWFDASDPFLEMAERLAADAPGPVRAAARKKGDLTTGPFPRAELVLASYALAELPLAAQAGTIERLWDACDGLLALVEPGTPAGYDRIIVARGVLAAAGARLLAPCPHADACPLYPPDWCHFNVRLPRSRDHKLAKGADAPFEDEKFAYLLAARPSVGGEAVAARVLAHPWAGKPGIEFKLCGAQGLERRFVPKRDKGEHARVRRLGWGSAWP